VNPDEVSDSVLNVVIRLLETEGYDAVTLRRVSSEGHFSFSTIYRRWESRDALIVAALDAWGSRYRFANLPAPAVPDGSIDSVRTDLMVVLRAIFEPWEQHPMVFRAYYRAIMTPEGRRLADDGSLAVRIRQQRVLDRVEPPFRDDLSAALRNLVHALMSRFANNEIGFEEFLPTLDRTLYWMLAGYESTGARALVADLSASGPAPQ
jgi:TetR/AcrR family transcriptional regulator, cholesterol catabolism regulator